VRMDYLSIFFCSITIAEDYEEKYFQNISGLVKNNVC